MRSMQNRNALRGRKNRTSMRPRTKLTKRNWVAMAASLFLLIVAGFIIFINLSDSKKSFASASGDYRSAASGNWSSTATWQKYNGSSWVAATAVPSSSDGIIEIRSGHTVTLTADVTVDQVVVDAGGTIVINSSRYLYTANGSGTDLVNNGTITVNGYLTQNASSTLTNFGTIQLTNGATEQIGTGASFTIASGGTYINNGGTVPTTTGLWVINGTYQHNTNGGNIPLATWNSGSTCNVTGVTTSQPGNLNQSFSNFTWNCPSQTTKESLGNNLTGVGGDLTIASTGTGSVRLTTTASSTLSVGGNLNMQGGTLYVAGSGNWITNVAGNFVQSGGSFIMTDATSSSGSGSPVLNVTGDFDLSSGTFNMSQYTASVANKGIGTLNVTGDFNLTGGTITETATGTGYGQINFVNSGSQNYSSSGATVSNDIQFTVNSGSNLNLGTSILAGNSFTLSSGGGITIGATSGISSSGASGNIQSSATRSFSTGADYTYNGSSAQSTGSGLPATIHNLILNNSAGLTLTNTTSVSNMLTFTSGKITTGSNELRITNTSSSAISGYSSSKYVIGNLRRTVSGSGTYDFPLGTSANYELITATLSGATGFTTILGTFTNSNPLSAILPLVNLVLNGLNITNLVNYGYWTLTPNSSMTGGTYSVTANEKGQSGTPGSACNFTLLKRSNILSGWQTLGTHVAGGLVNSIATATRSGLTSFSDFAIGYGESLSFTSPTLINGTAGQVNAVYKFANACTNVDVWIQILSISGGAALSSMDDNSSGYDEAWQPFVDAAANTTSSILWKLTFKVAGTSTDTTISQLTITGIDVDGEAQLKEYIEATLPYSYNIDPSSDLTITNTGTAYRATSSTVTHSNIDTSAHDAMFQITYQNVNNFQYRTGAVSTKSTVDTRQNSLYFKSFFNGTGVLPIKLLYFKAKLDNDKVDFDWATSSEVNNDYFIVERSSDGENFEGILRENGAGNSTNNKYYTAKDDHPLEGYSYYRLKQTDFDGHSSYSEVETVKYKTLGDEDESGIKITSVAPNPFTDKFTLSFTLKTAAPVDFQLLNSAGQSVFKDLINSNDRMNQYDFIDKQGLLPGIYFIVLSYDDKKQVQKIVKN